MTRHTLTDIAKGFAPFVWTPLLAISDQLIGVVIALALVTDWWVSCRKPQSGESEK